MFYSLANHFLCFHLGQHQLFFHQTSSMLYLKVSTNVLKKKIEHHEINNIGNILKFYFWIELRAILSK